MFRAILKWIRAKVFGKRDSALPLIAYAKTNHVVNPPSLEEVAAGEFYVVGRDGNPRWVMFQCPCKCGEVITLSLQKIHRPHWALDCSTKNMPTLHPSVWRNAGCRSHFWIRDGKILWCNDAISPDNQRG